MGLSDDEKKSGPVVNNPEAHDDESDTDQISLDAQDGVKQIEATTKVWTKTALIVAYVMCVNPSHSPFPALISVSLTRPSIDCRIWVIYFVDSTQQGTTGTLTTYVTSKFDHHSLTPAVNIMSSLIGGISKLTLAKILDVWGRPQGYLVSIIICTLGIIMMAACRNVETYAAAQVFYWVG